MGSESAEPDVSVSVTAEAEPAAEPASVADEPAAAEPASAEPASAEPASAGAAEPVSAAAEPVADAAASATDEPELPNKERVIREIIQSIPKTSSPIDTMKGKLVSMMKELDADQVKNENENRENVERVSDSIQKEQARIDKERETLKNLYSETERLNATLQKHYSQMLDDAKYLKSLDKMRPGFLKSLSKLASHIKNVKDIVDQQLVKDEYKDEMMSILSDLHFNTHNISGYLATVFMNHYNKYKSRLQGDNGSYTEDVARLESLASQFKEQSKKVAKLEKEKERLQDILSRIKDTLTLTVSQRDDFERLSKEVVSIFVSRSRECSKVA